MSCTLFPSALSPILRTCEIEIRQPNLVQIDRRSPTQIARSILIANVEICVVSRFYECMWHLAISTGTSAVNTTRSDLVWCNADNFLEIFSFGGCERRHRYGHVIYSSFSGSFNLYRSLLVTYFRSALYQTRRFFFWSDRGLDTVTWKTGFLHYCKSPRRNYFRKCTQTTGKIESSSLFLPVENVSIPLTFHFLMDETRNISAG